MGAMPEDDMPAAETGNVPGHAKARHAPNLRLRIVALILGLVCTTLVWSGSTLWFTRQTEDMIVQMADRDIQALFAAQGLETALTQQKGYATYYFLSRDPQWLDKLAQGRAEFEAWLGRARDSAAGETARAILNSIESQYLRYVHDKNEVLDLYRRGRWDEGASKHWEARKQFEEVLVLCERYKELHQGKIASVAGSYKAKARAVAALSLGAVPFSVLLGVLLALILFRRILLPIRQLALSTGATEGPGRVVNEIDALSERMRGLVEDVDETHSKLKQSREHLIQAEKLALVGRLAAGVAHSIRNPLTSVKMRLFSLERSLALNKVQREDFEVISEEIRHLDTIIGNFLEFSRRPKLRFTMTSPSEVVDTTLQLLRHRIDSCQVEVSVLRDKALPEVSVDTDQLKEALANLVMNACEAMSEGGRLVIEEEQGVMEPLGDVVIIRLMDSGPGIPAAMQDKVFEPFFSTKEEGTGLGLAIARRVLEEHGGWLHLRSEKGRGAHFVLVIPLSREEAGWHRS